MEKIKLEDFLNYTYLGNVKVSPDGSKIAFIKSQANKEDNEYDSYLYIVKGNECKQLTSTGKESNFIWEDNNTILFTNIRDKKDLERKEQGEELSVFYRINIDGGEAIKAFEIPLSVNKITVLDNECYLCNVSYDEVYSSMYSLSKEGKEKLLKQKKESKDYEIVTENPFYFNGQGFINNCRNTLFIYDAKTKQLERILDPYFSVSRYDISNDKNNIIISGAKYTKIPPLKEGIYLYRLKDKKCIEVLPDDTISVHDIKFREKDILVCGSYCEEYGINENPKFYSLNTLDKRINLLYDFDYSIGSSVGSDCRLIGGEQSKVDKYNNNYYFVSTILNESKLLILEQNEPKEMISYAGSVDCFDTYNGNIYFIGMKDGKLQELYHYTDGRITQLSSFNNQNIENKYIAEYHEITFEYQEETLYGWILEPNNYNPDKMYPAILDIHGGPKTVYGKVFYHEMQYWANQGAFVFFMNPHGSDGRGNEFMDIRGKYGTIDYEEIMKFVDIVTDKYPAINKNKIAVTGGSYGGFMTNWIIGHTNRFVSAASQRSIANWLGFTYTSDIGLYFSTDQQSANIYDNPEKLWWHSPLKYANQIKTPTLFIHSDEDYRCPISEGYQMYSALLEQGIETKLVLFHGENHELSRGGKPTHRVKRLKEITNWLFESFHNE